MSGNLVHIDDGDKTMLYLKEIVDEKQKPDIVLLDLRLPKVDGMEILRFIKENEFLNDIPVVVLTTSALEQKIIELNGNSPDGYLVKPIDFIKFLELMHSFGLTQFNEIKR
jgi:CheY-like chemotaxis protein